MKNNSEQMRQVLRREPLYGHSCYVLHTIKINQVIKYSNSIKEAKYTVIFNYDSTCY